jgi:propionaldehyde dehydrogenase
VELDRERISKIVEEVVRRYTSGEGPAALATAPAPSPVGRGRGIFATGEECVQAARTAFNQLAELSLEKRGAILEAMRQTGLAHAREMAEMAVAETGLGRPEDKVQKNILVCRKTPGLEDLTPVAYSGDRGLSLVELAPFGVICSVTPTTNPVATIINNGISMVAAGNSVVFNPHPRAKNCCLRMIGLLNEAIVKAGGPENLLTSVAEPTVETSQALMQARGIDCLVVTGGPAVVRQAMTCGKKVIAAGPGNPPVVVDETADLAQAARDVVAGASFDNNIMCTCEKEVFIVDSVFRPFKDKLLAQNCYELTPRQLEELTRIIFQPPPVGSTRPVLNRDLIGKYASEIAKRIGLDLPRETRLLVAETPPDHPLVMNEQMMPVLPLVRARHVDEAIQMAVRAEGRRNHTAVVHSKNIEVLHRFAKVSNANVFVKNGPNYAGLGFGGEGHTSMTIAGATGEGITSARTFTRSRRCTLVDYFRIV